MTLRDEKSNDFKLGDFDFQLRDAKFTATKKDGRLGIRVHRCIIGPRARRGHVEPLQFDPNSILDMITWRFGFEPPGVRGGSTNLFDWQRCGRWRSATSSPSSQGLSTHFPQVAF